MIVLVSAMSNATGISGVQRHALNLVRALSLCDEIERIHVAVGPWQQVMKEELSRSAGPRVELHMAGPSRGAFSRAAWHYTALPALAARLLVDLVHFTYPVPVNGGALICRSVVTLHDLYPYEIPSNYGLPRLLHNRCVLRQCLHSADAIACVSDHTRNELQHYLGSEFTAKSVRIHNCVELPRAKEMAAIEGLARSPFLLCVAQHRRNKNLPFLLRVIKHLITRLNINLRTQLVIVGMPGPETPTILRHIRKLNLQDHVVLLEGLSDPELGWYFTHCEALLAPSLTEGFGLPLVEGMLGGCRVVCSDIPAFRELGKEHCTFVDLMDPKAEARYADAILSCLARPKPFPVLLPQLSTTVIGQQYVALYEAVLNRHPALAKDRALQEPTGRSLERRVL